MVIETRPNRRFRDPVNGFLHFAALLASILNVPQPPKANASTAKILAYYIDHRRMLLFSQWLGGLGAALFLWFAGSLRGAWGRGPDSAGELSAVAFGGGIALVGAALAGTGVNLTLAYMARNIQNSVDLVRALYAGQALIFTLVFFPAAVFLVESWLTGGTTFAAGWLPGAGAMGLINS